MGPGKKPYVVAIAGGTCSGKSTFSTNLERDLSDRFRIKVFHMDQYFKQPVPNTVAPITGKTYVEHNHPDSIRLDALYADVTEACAGQEFELVIIEGLFALSLDVIRNAADLKIFLDLKSDERIVRRIQRFTAMGQTMEEVTDRYLDTVRFRHDELVEPTRWHADCVINGVRNDKALEIIETYLCSVIVK